MNTKSASARTSGIERAIQYFHSIRDYLRERKSPCQAIVAFSGEHEYHGEKVTEASLNGFPSSQIADRIQEDPYRFLVCAEKFQTGYDEPLLHTMYVDKILSGIKAVQTLCRLHRADSQKHDVFVLDFLNDTDTIQAAFADYYRTTILCRETDPNKLHDLKRDLDGAQVYAPEQIEELVTRYLAGADRDRLDPILNACVATYQEQLDEDGQVDFKGNAKAFCRTYGFLSCVLPYTNAEWERLSIFLNFLIPKLPAPKEEDLSKGILESIDMDSYRVEKHAVMQLQLPPRQYTHPVVQLRFPRANQPTNWIAGQIQLSPDPLTLTAWTRKISPPCPPALEFLQSCFLAPSRVARRVEHAEVLERPLRCDTWYSRHP